MTSIDIFIGYAGCAESIIEKYDCNYPVEMQHVTYQGESEGGEPQVFEGATALRAFCERMDKLHKGPWRLRTIG